MQYDFTTIMDRRGKDAIAVDAPAGNNTGNDFFAGAKIREGFDLIPMWVADMNFPALPAIPEAIIPSAALSLLLHTALLFQFLCI